MGILANSPGYIGNFDFTHLQTNYLYTWYSVHDADGNSIYGVPGSPIQARRDDGNSSVDSSCFLQSAAIQPGPDLEGLMRVRVRIWIDQTFFINNHDYTLWLDWALDTQDVNVIICHFSLENRL
jgi:hypothetical protein